MWGQCRTIELGSRLWPTFVLAISGVLSSSSSFLDSVTGLAIARSLPEIQRRLRWAERLLYAAARNKGQQGHRSLLELLDRLQKEGLLRVERGCAEQGAGEVYSLTILERIDSRRNEPAEAHSYRSLSKKRIWTNHSEDF
jgi:hypothetical protein